MALKDIFRKKVPLQEVKNQEDKDLNKDLVPEAIDRIRESLKDWADAVTNAENPHLDESIKYEEILNLFNNIDFDEHVTALTDTILNDVSQTPFNIFDAGGKIDEDKTKLFEKSWFHSWLDFVLQADYWIFSLIQFGEIKNGIFSKVSLVDRYHVRPEGGYVSKQRYQDTKDFIFTEDPLEKWTMLVESRKHLGRFNVIAKSFILKREVRQFWAVFNELFTTPYYTVKTNFANKKHRNDLINWLQKRKHSGSVVVGIDDEIQALTNGGTGYKSYEDFENSANKSMSKAFLGQTMVFEDGSSRSQAEVHERQKNTFVQAKRILVSFLINEELIPKMAALGIKISETDTFKWNLSQTLTVKEWSEIIVSLAPFFDLDIDQVIEKIGLTLDVKEQMETFADPEKKEELKNRIKAMYNQSK